MTVFFSRQVRFAVDGDGAFDWSAAFHLSMTDTAVNVTVNVKLVGVEPGAALRNTWTNVAETHWNNKAFFSDGEWLYKINFNFNFVNSGQHHTVTVHSGPGRFNMTNWYTQTEGWTPDKHDEIAAHEIGHMFGLPDEYAGGATFNGYTTTGTLMSTLTPRSNTTDAGYENYFGDIEYYVQEYGYGDPEYDGVELVLAKLGSTGNDVLTGTAGGDPILGLDGNDVLRGLDGNDHLEGGAGNDTLVGGMGYNVMDGGPGIDTVDYRFYNGPVEIDLFGGNAWFIGDTDPEYLSTIENVLTGNGNDVLYGNHTGNLLNGGGGSDWMEGLNGNDTFVVNTLGDTVIEAAGGGTDTVVATAGYVLTAGQQVEVMTTSNAAAATKINLTGNSFAQSITGNAGINVLNGAGGADVMSGLGGNDVYIVDVATDRIVEAAGRGTDVASTSASYTLGIGVSVETLQAATAAATTALRLTGNAFANIVLGNNGANVINGAAGSDTLTGRAGADSFLFNTSLGTANVDRITDFNVAADEIQLENNVFQALGAAAAAIGADAFHVGTAAADAEDRIIYNSASGALSYDFNGTGAQGVVVFAFLPKNLALTRLDIEIV